MTIEKTENLIFEDLILEIISDSKVIQDLFGTVNKIIEEIGIKFNKYSKKESDLSEEQKSLIFRFNLMLMTVDMVAILFQDLIKRMIEMQLIDQGRINE